MKYVAYTCRRSLQAVRDYPRLYTPIERCREGGELVERPAFPGYVFSPAGKSIPPAILMKYRMVPVVMNAEHVAVEQEDLAQVQLLLNERFENHGRSDFVEYHFEPGDEVRVFGDDHMLAGMVGVFSKYKGASRGRVSMSFGYVDIELRFLSKENG